MKNILLLIGLFLLPFPSFAAEPRYAVALIPTPVLNRPDPHAVFGGKNGRLALDTCNQFRSLEYIALPGTVFTIEQEIRSPEELVYRVTTEEYPYPSATGHFVESRFVTPSAGHPPPRKRALPPRAEIRDKLIDAVGTPYVWGGNVRRGIPEMTEIFPVPQGRKIGTDELRLRQLAGVDCSGLLYEATGGVTPRNTSALLRFGQAVQIAGLSARQLAARLEPLDLIVWKGHVQIVLDRETLIESRLRCGKGDGGVVLRPLLPALQQLLRSKTGLNEYREPVQGERAGFVVRRWYGLP